MFGLDDHIAELSHGGSILIVLLVATLLGLRHATDPDHLAAVTTLMASGRDHARRRAAARSAPGGASGTRSPSSSSASRSCSSRRTCPISSSAAPKRRWRR